MTAITPAEVRFSFAEDPSPKNQWVRLHKAFFAANCRRERKLPAKTRELNNPNFSLSCCAYTTNGFPELMRKQPLGPKLDQKIKHGTRVL